MRGGDETMKQIMKRGLKLFLILCLLVESFSTAVAVKAEETADKGRMVKIYVAGTLVETKWYNYGEKVQLPKFYERRKLDDAKVVEFIREWRWYWEKSCRRSTGYHIDIRFSCRNRWFSENRWIYTGLPQRRSS